MSNVRMLPIAEGRTAPHDLDAEAAVISAVVVDSTRYAQVSAFLRPEHFFAEAHRRIFEAAAALHDAGKPTDTVTIANWLKDRERLMQIGGIQAITALIDCSPSFANIVTHATIVHEKWRARQAILVCQEAAARGYVDFGTTQEFIDGIGRSIANLARLNAATPIESNLEALRRLVRGLHELGNNPESGTHRTLGIPTGLWGYDAMTYGLQPGQKTTIAALPGRGKTALALQIAVHAAKQGVGVLFFSTEMKRDELLLRMLSAATRIDGQRLKAAKLQPAEWTRLFGCVAELETLPLWIDESPDVDVDQIRARTLAHVERTTAEKGAPLGLVVIDYVQRLRGAKSVERRERHEQISHATKAIKMLAQELQIPIIELAQEKASEVDKVSKIRPRPDTGYTADCKTIGKEADVLVFLRRNPLRSQDGKIIGEDPSALTLIVDKQRGGDTGDLQLKFRRECAVLEYVPGEA